MEKLENRFIILVMKIFKELRDSNFEHGLQTELCHKYGVRYGFKGQTLSSHVSYAKWYNKINSTSFKMGTRNNLIIEQLNDYSRSELEELLVLVNTEEKLDLLSYLTNKENR